MKPFIRFAKTIHPNIVWEDELGLDADQLEYARSIADQLKLAVIPETNAAVVYWGHELDFAGTCIEAKSDGIAEWKKELSNIFYSAYPPADKKPMTSLEVSKKYFGKDLEKWQHNVNAIWLDKFGSRIAVGGVFTWKDGQRDFIKQSDGRWIELETYKG